jgi:hypothetical protein
LRKLLRYPPKNDAGDSVAQYWKFSRTFRRRNIAYY